MPYERASKLREARVRWYKHNDVEDMQRVLARVVKDNAKKPLTRRFIITEGLFENVGDMVTFLRL